MIATPLYNQHRALSLKPDKAHTGLWFERFFNGYDEDWKIHDEAKQKWIKQVAGPINNPGLDEYHKRQQALLMALKGESHAYQTDWHFVSGMGYPHPVENGLSWHPTLAVPYLPGSAVKGLTRAWLEMQLEELKTAHEPNNEAIVAVEQHLLDWFGTKDKQDDAEQAGAFMFFDALPDAAPYLICDIMTPHMGKWYEQGDKGDVNNANVLPADWHEPVPVAFLAVKQAHFVFSIAVRDNKHQADLKAVFEALDCALQWLGAGAKTATGYGYMHEDTTFYEKFQSTIQAGIENKAFEQQLAQSSEMAQAFRIEAKNGNWANDKDKFMQDGVKSWLDKLEVQADQETLDLMIDLIDQYFKGLLADPDKVKGKKKTPVFKLNQIDMAKRVNALLDAGKKS